MSRNHLAVVGAGLAGLAAAEQLAARATVTVLDRLPVPGGVLPFDDRAVRRLADRCSAAGVRWQLGTTAVRWQDGRLLVAGPAGICWLQADHLVFAGGSRPATAAELPITGPRLAGMLPAPVAIHLAEARVVLGRHIVIVGTGDWARSARQAIAGQRCRVTVVAGQSAPEPQFEHDGLIRGWVPASVTGSGRVSALQLNQAGQRYAVACDAVILAGSPRPLRNVDGAIADPSAGVTFVQPVAELTTGEETAQVARRAVADLAVSASR